MDDRDISSLLLRLENGEVSEDESDLDEDILDYNDDHVDELQAELEQADLEEEEHVEDLETPDPPLILDELPDNQPRPVPSLRNLVWKKSNMALVEQAFTFLGNTDYPQNILNLSTPYQYFSYFVDQSLLERIITESNKYAIQKNINFSEPMSILELRKYIGILIYTSVYHYPSIRAYWSNKVRFHPIADTMTVNRFEKIREILHFNDNESHLPPEHPKHDRLHKIRPVVDHLNQRFMSVPFDQRLSLDEQMCASKISHFMKQYLPNKPHKWGFKLYVLCCLMGYAYSFEVFSGTHDLKRLPNEPDLGAVSNTVVRLLRHVPRKVNHIVYFDNFYSNLTLFQYLCKEGIYCLGTVQRNRLGKTCKLPKKEDVMKTSVPRGTYEENVTSLEGIDLAALSWKDNKQVVLLSTYVGANPVGTINRYDKKQKKSITIPCPKAIQEYNAHMGGVDTMDSYLGRYRIRMKSKKWTNRLFVHMLDMAVINSWILYKKVSIRKGTNPKNILKLADFRTELAETLCRYGAVSENKRGRPSLNRSENTSQKRPKLGAQTLPSQDVRTDGVGHDKSYGSKRNQCKYANCKKLTSVMCTKCKISLCDNRKNNCFQVFHT